MYDPVGYHREKARELYRAARHFRRIGSPEFKTALRNARAHRRLAADWVLGSCRLEAITPARQIEIDQAWHVRERWGADLRYPDYGCR